MKKGFTLIELLAVIVILAIIALIATPIILGIIDDARIGSIEASANGYIDAVEYSSATLALKGKELDDGAYDISTIDVKLDGEKPTSGIVTIEKGKVINATLNVNNNVVYYDGKVSKVINDKADNYKEQLLNGADPVLKDGLIPVVILNDGTVIKANTKTNWYSYENKIWANAVILFDTKTYKEGEVIPEENIKSYFVWIPKYSYKLFNVDSYESGINEIPKNSNAQEIKIKFGLNTTNDNNSGECTTPMLSGEIGNCEVGEYMTHPAFISFNTNGFWVSKFEATGSVDSLESKPNVSSLRNITVSEMFNISYNFNRNLDSHMIKNTEWGAIAYLSHSKYGINNEVNINNNSDYLTGYSATEKADQTKYPGGDGTDPLITQPYNTKVGYKASTTGNISGIYDMSGGNHEYTSSYVDGDLSKSGFTTESIQAYDSKYFDIYIKESNGTKFNTGILGDATVELGPFYNFMDGDGNNRNHNSWYNSISLFIQSYVSWFHRGGTYDEAINAGQFRFSHYTGEAQIYRGFRFVLAF